MIKKIGKINQQQTKEKRKKHKKKSRKKQLCVFYYVCFALSGDFNDN